MSEFKSGFFVGGENCNGRVLIVDDVMSAGTAARESIALIRAAGAVPHAMTIALDRQEKATENGRDVDHSAVQYVRDALGLQVCAIAKLEDLLKVADVITIHAPLTDETNKMINADAVSKMKPGAYLISTARGPICDTGALLEGLKSNRILAVGLDVLPTEPATLDDPLVKAWQANEPWIKGRVLMGPHSGFYSPDSLVDLRTKAAQTACLYLKENKLINCVNAEFLKKPR